MQRRKGMDRNSRRRDARVRGSSVSPTNGENATVILSLRGARPGCLTKAPSAKGLHRPTPRLRGAQRGLALWPLNYGLLAAHNRLPHARARSPAAETSFLFRERTVQMSLA